MDNVSRLGCVCYYDYKLYGPQLCEPTALFLLGLEAVVTPSSAYTDIVPVIDKETGEQKIDEESGEPLFEEIPNETHLNKICLRREDIPDAFDRAYNYFYDEIPKQKVTDIEYDCYGLKIAFNDITGTSPDRIVPLIYHDDLINRKVDDLSVEYAHLVKIFNYAGYNKKDNSVHYKGKFGITDEEELASIEEYNANLKNEHKEKKFYSQIYKTLDYKAMYSYALGVLYGCICLGYDAESVWKREPALWYDGEYVNLVSSAQIVFHFHYLHHICDVDIDKRLAKKYKGIQVNEVYNFEGGDDYDFTYVEPESDIIDGGSYSFEDFEVYDPDVQGGSYSFEDFEVDYVEPEIVEPDYIEVMLACGYSCSAEYMQVPIGKNVGTVVDVDEYRKLLDFGIETTGYISGYASGPYGFIICDDDHTYEPIALYADPDGCVQQCVDMGNYYCDEVEGSRWLRINSKGPASLPSMQWKVRITEK